MIPDIISGFGCSNSNMGSLDLIPGDNSSILSLILSPSKLGLFISNAGMVILSSVGLIPSIIPEIVSSLIFGFSNSNIVLFVILLLRYI